jgi:hypothetical protein
MTHRILPLGLVLGAVVAAGPLLVVAAEPIDAQKKFAIEEANPAPGRIPDGGVMGIPAYTWRFTDLNNPDRVGWTATVAYSYLGKHLKKGERMYAVRLNLPPGLPQGTIFPLLGFLYSVNSNRGDMLTLEWVPEAKFPDGLKPVKPDSLFVHLDPTSDVSGTTFMLDDKGVMARLMLRKVEREKDGAKRLVATFVYQNSGDKPLQVDVREGDVLATPHAGGYEIRSIVPADPKNKVLGWIELSSKPIADADLTKEKRPVVRFPAAK